TGPKSSAKGSSASAPGIAAQGGTDWDAIVARLDLDGMTRQLAQQCCLVSRDENHLRLAVDSKHKHLLTPRLEKSLQAAVASEFGDRCKLVIEQAEGKVANPPAAKRSAEEAARQTQAERAIADDPHVAA